MCMQCRAMGALGIIIQNIMVVIITTSPLGLLAFYIFQRFTYFVIELMLFAWV